MKITVTGRQMPVYEGMKETLEKKLGKFDRYFNGDASANVTLKNHPRGKEIEITINALGTLFRSEVQADSFRDALDEAVANIDRQIRKNKTRLAKRLRDNTFIEPTVDFDDGSEEEVSILRTKSYPVRPMSPEDAILEMNLLGHNFFVFVDSVNGCTSVVYKRKDGGYGILLPEA